MSNQASFLLFTAPAPTGVSFLLSNLAAANATKETPVALIDLSRDRGTLSYLNPTLEEQQDGWERYSVRYVQGLRIYGLAKGALLSTKQVVTHIQTAAQHAKWVLVDLPWEHPWRKELFHLGPAVAIIDTDYHHWVQWEQATEHAGWHGDVWVNQSDINMEPMIQEAWGRAPIRHFPYFPEARKSLFRGRPLAIEDEEKRKHFLLS